MTGRQRFATLSSIQHHARGGTTQHAIAQALGTTINHLQRWAGEDQVFHDALHCGDAARISLVTDALFENALPREAVQERTKRVRRKGEPDELHVTTTRERIGGDTAAQRMFLQAARPELYHPEVQAKINILNAQVNPMTINDHSKDPRRLAMALLAVIRDGASAAERDGPLDLGADTVPLPVVEHEPETAGPASYGTPPAGAWPSTQPAYSDGADTRREQRKEERRDGGSSYGPEDETEDFGAGMTADFDAAFAADREADDYDPRD